MPRSNGRPKDRQQKQAAKGEIQRCICGGKATRFGVCVRCLDAPVHNLQLQAMGIYPPSRKQRDKRPIAEVG